MLNHHLGLRVGRTQPRNDSAWPPMGGPIGVLQSASHARLVLPMLVSESEMAVARSRATLPSPRSWSSLSCEAHSGMELPAQFAGLVMSHVSGSSMAVITAWDLRTSGNNGAGGSQVSTSTLSTVTGSLLNGPALLCRSSGKAPIAGLVRPLNAATGTSMAMKHSPSIIAAIKSSGSRQEGRHHTHRLKFSKPYASRII